MNSKRFIAGAVCPRCAEMDRLVTFEHDGNTYKECVSCGYEEKQIANVQLSELDTRVNNVESETDNAEPVKMMLGKSAKKNT